MSDNAETTSSSNDQTENETKSDLDVNTSTPIRLFGQFKPNGFGFNNLSPSIFGQNTFKEKTDDQNSSSTYFTNSLSKLSSTNTTGFGSSSTPLAASLASLGANKPLFGGSSGTTPSSFTDLKGTSINSKKNDDEEEDNGEGENDDEEEEKASLLETVAEYEAKRASTHPATTIQGDTSTGEENEITKFQMAGKLFMYNGEQQQFVERGYGIVKINESHDPSDWDRLQARLIMRLDKSFRVILNSPIFPKMTVERATDRSVRFGAQDESQLRVFIIKTSAIDCSNFCKELQSRIEIIERQQSSNTPSKSSNTSASSDVIILDDTSPKQNTSTSHTRKRSHSQSDSDASEKTNDLSKKSKLVEGYREGNKDTNQSTSEDDSFGTNKSNEKESAHS
jgi:Ran-binding protein 3